VVDKEDSVGKSSNRATLLKMSFGKQKSSQGSPSPLKLVQAIEMDDLSRESENDLERADEVENNLDKDLVLSPSKETLFLKKQSFLEDKLKTDPKSFHTFKASPGMTLKPEEHKDEIYGQSPMMMIRKSLASSLKNVFTGFNLLGGGDVRNSSPNKLISPSKLAHKLFIEEETD
jgi:hypothetical protein